MTENWKAKIAALERQKDGAYTERNRLVAALAWMAIAFGWRAGVSPDTTQDGWDLVFIKTPNGQLSWHIPSSEADLFDGLPPYLGEWDGHTSQEKYERLANLFQIIRPLT